MSNAYCYKPFVPSVYIAVSDTIHVMHELAGALPMQDLGKFGQDTRRHSCVVTSRQGCGERAWIPSSAYV